MNTNFRKTLIAGAIAALLTSPALATNGLPGNAPAEEAATPATEQPRDNSSQMKSGRDGMPEQSGSADTQTGQSTTDPSRMGRGPGEDASRSAVADHPLYSRTPDELSDMEVVGSDGEDIGKIKAVVMDPSQTKVHAVISSGGFLGLGAREILVSLDELQPLGSDQVQAGFTQDQVETLPKYESEQYTELESDRPIIEFSAFEPGTDKADPAMKGRDAEPGMNDRTPAQRGQPQ